MLSSLLAKKPPAEMNRTAQRLAIVATHPIQYYAPLYRALARVPDLELQVIFCSQIGLNDFFDAGFAQKLHWKNDLVGGYQHAFLDDAKIVDSREIDRLDNPSVTEALGAFDPDCVLIQGYSTKTMRRALAWGNRNNVPVLLFADSAYPDGVRFPKSVIKKILLGHLYRRISGFFCMGDAGRVYHRHYGAPDKRIYFCPYTIDEGVFEAARSQRASLHQKVREQYGIAESDVAVLFCGKLIARKRPADIVRAAAKLREGTVGADNLVLMFCGDGELREQIRSLASRLGVRAAFLGFHNMDTIGSVYCAADAIVLPSEREPYGVVLAEAAFFGLPLIVSEAVGAVGPNSLARPGDNALVFPVGDIDRLAGHLGRMLDPETRKRMGERSRANYELQSTAVCAANIASAVRPRPRNPN